MRANCCTVHDSNSHSLSAATVEDDMNGPLTPPCEESNDAG